MVGGSSDPSVIWSPGVSLQEKAGRPMGPSTLRCEFLWEIVVVYVGLVFWVFSFLSVLCDAVVISQGSVFCRCFFEPFTTRPVFGVCLRPSSFVWLFSSATFFLSLALSQALGNPKPFWFGVPLVFLHPGHAHRPRPVHRRPHIPQGIAPAPVFFFSFFSRRSRWVVCSVLVFGGGFSVRVRWRVSRLPPPPSPPCVACLCCVSCILLLHAFNPATCRPQWPRPLPAYHLARPSSPASCWETSGGRAGW